MTVTHAALVPHVTTPCAAVRGLAARVVLTASGQLSLYYVLRAPLAQLAIPAPRARRFCDGLWQHTCFEAFVAADGASAYRELNFAPSGEWAVYAFTGLREGRAPLPTVPRLATRRDVERFELDAVVELGELFDRPWKLVRLGLAAVIESADGSLSYWALRHPTDRPDFHHRGSFLLSLS
jgi:hypothetical protein